MIDVEEVEVWGHRANSHTSSCHLKEVGEREGEKERDTTCMHIYNRE